MHYYQESLFPNPRAHAPDMPYCLSCNALMAWKHKVAQFQRQVLLSQPLLNPFALPPQPMEFFRLPQPNGGDACLYFVIDQHSQIILYIGETQRSDRRWQGEHDCKGYLENYRNAHQVHNLTVQISLAFWWDTARDRSDRQKLELQLINQWLPPFNKQNWQRWHTPFLNIPS